MQTSSKEMFKISSFLSGLCYWALIMYVFVACTSNPYTEEDLKQYVTKESNGLVKSKSPNRYEVKITYRPIDLLIMQEIRGRVSVDSVELETLKSKYEKYHYFLLSISENDKEALYSSTGGFEQFSTLLQKLSFEMRDYVNLTTGRDTLHVADYIYSRTYGMSGATSLMFAFSRDETMVNEWVQFNLKEFGLNIGDQHFRFLSKDIKDIPKINFDSYVSSRRLGIQSYLDK